jgi:predicted small secreted protein
MKEKKMKEATQRKWILPTLAAFCALMAAACNTVEGAGRDVSAAGGAVSGAASETRQDIQH